MMSLNRSCFLGKPGIAGSSSPFSQSQKRRSTSLKVVAVVPKVRTSDRNGSVMMENPLQDVKAESEVFELKSTVHGGVQDVYGEDTATEDQLVTPWSVSVASGYTLIRSPHHNKGLAFTKKERDAHYLRGLLPPIVISQELQVKKMINSIRQYQVPLQKYIAMIDLQGRNEKLFYKLLIEHVEELLPVVYTPTVGETCQKYGSIFTQPQGLFISLKEKCKILEVLRNWPEKNIQVIVVTDGERILGLGDLGCHGMGIPVGKLALYTALGGVRPSACLPVTIDVGTNNEKLLNDEFYIGLRQKRATGQEYAELLQEFMTAVKQNYGEKVLVQFENFANHNAFELLAKYASTHLTPQQSNAKPGLRKPVFTKVELLKPETSGHTIVAKVLGSNPVLQKGRSVSQHLRQTRISECLIGDETGTILFTARNDQVDLMKPGATVILRNARIDMFKGSMRLAVDKWGRIEVTEPANFVVKEDSTSGTPRRS
ncbi:hypothetical protein ACFX1Q_024956 [Malus domestica]